MNTFAVFCCCSWNFHSYCLGGQDLKQLTNTFFNFGLKPPPAETPDWWIIITAHLGRDFCLEVNCYHFLRYVPLIHPLDSFNKFFLFFLYIFVSCICWKRYFWLSTMRYKLGGSTTKYFTCLVMLDPPQARKLWTYFFVAWNAVITGLRSVVEVSFCWLPLLRSVVLIRFVYMNGLLCSATSLHHLNSKLPKESPEDPGHWWIKPLCLFWFLKILKS